MCAGRSPFLRLISFQGFLISFEAPGRPEICRIFPVGHCRIGQAQGCSRHALSKRFRVINARSGRHSRIYRPRFLVFPSRVSLGSLGASPSHFPIFPSGLPTRILPAGLLRWASKDLHWRECPFTRLGMVRRYVTYAQHRFLFSPRSRPPGRWLT
jgi:hypothetical protein